MNGRSRRVLAVVLIYACGLAVACDSLPGKPTQADRYVRPADNLDFDSLYGQHCSGCHGANGRFGAARPMNDPIFLAVAGKAHIIRAATMGQPGTPMPPFSISEGGVLTDTQIETIATGILERWGDPEAAGRDLPPYSAADSLAAGFASGNAEAGHSAFETHCARCHGADGTGGKEAGSVVNGSYLALSTDQSLRNTVIAGRLDLGMPNFREYGTPSQHAQLTPQEISDVVAWLGTHRQEFPGQTYPEGTTTPPIPARKEKL